MRNSRIINGLVSFILIGAPALAFADSISSDIPNGQFAPLTILEDHPQCNGAGQTAFNVEFETGNLSYRAQNAQSLREVAVSTDGVVAEDDARCFVTQMSGVERIQVEVICSDCTLQRSPFEGRNLSQTTISVSGTFSVCQSPFAYEVMESSWRAQINNPKVQSEVTGTVFQYPVQGCEDAVPALGPKLYLDYVQTTSAGMPFGYSSRFPYNKPNVVSPAQPTFFRLIFNDI